MKSQSSKLFVITLVLGLAAFFGTAGAASAQSTLTFEVPFDFQVGKTEMTAGKYEMTRMNFGRYLLRNTDTKNSSIVFFDISTGKINRSSDEKIVFNRYGETYFLRSLYDKPGENGHELTESKSEKELRRGISEKGEQLADKKKKPEQVSINSNKNK